MFASLRSSGTFNSGGSPSESHGARGTTENSDRTLRRRNCRVGNWPGSELASLSRVELKGFDWLLPDSEILLPASKCLFKRIYIKLPKRASLTLSLAKLQILNKELFYHPTLTISDQNSCKRHMQCILCRATSKPGQATDYMCSRLALLNKTKREPPARIEQAILRQTQGG